MYEEVKKTQKLYCNRAMFFAISVAFIFIILGEKALGKGLVLGTLFSVFNFVIMGMLMARQIAEGQKRARARSMAFLSIFIRFSLLAIPLVVSLKSESINIFGAIAGIFMVQITILFNNLIVSRFSKIRKA